MAGESTYKEFDTSSIVTTSTSYKDTISVGKFAIRKREVFLAAVAIIALLGVIVLAIVLAVKASDWKGNGHGSVAGTARQTSGQGGRDGDVAYCQSLECLKAAVFQKPILDEVIDPCQDFYTFACGHYAQHHQQTPYLADVTSITEIGDENIQRLVLLLDAPSENDHDNHYEKKLKTFMKSCGNHFDKMDLRGDPLINHVIKPMGGWWVFGDDDALVKFDLQSSLEKVHIEYWADAFFVTNLMTNSNNWNKVIVELEYGGMGLNYLYYRNFDYLLPVHEHYKDYMKHLAVLLSIDNRISPKNDRIQQFAEDAFEVEVALAETLFNSYTLSNAHLPEYLVTLSELTDHLNGTLDFVNYMKTLFNEYPSKFDVNTKVAVKRYGYFQNLGMFLDHMMRIDVDGKRKLHNYLMWRVIQQYAKDLSWDYIHAERRFNYDLYEYKDDSSGAVQCFYTALDSFGDAINSVYIRDHIKQEGKDEASEILEEIKSVLVEGIKNLNWMTQDNRNYAAKKIRDSLYKIGFPEQLVDENYLNNEYSFVDIKEEDYFGNVLNLHKLKRQAYNRVISKEGSRAEWTYHVFDPIVDYYNPWHELIVTSAMMQSPLFRHNGPKYYNYGGVGSILASSLIHAIDEQGSYYKADGSQFGDWWTNTTRQHYQELKQCAIKAQEHISIGPLADKEGNPAPVNISMYSEGWAPYMLADSSGIRISYMAYKNQQDRAGRREKVPPSLSKYTTEQMFFLTWAQAHCQNTPDATKFNQLVKGRYPGKNRVNLAVREVPEFQNAFSCPSSRPGVSQHPDKKCMLFNLL